MSDFTTRDGCRLHYTDVGAGPETLVVVPGWSQTAAMFDRLTEVLEGRLRVVAYDHRNHGESGRTDNGARIATLAADLRELLDHLGLDRTHVLGHSMGCSVLWSYADLFGTDRFATMTLVDQPSACAQTPWLTAEQAADAGAILDLAGLEGFAGALLSDASDTARADFLTSMLTPDIPPADYDWMLAENLKLPMPFGARLLVDHVVQDWRDVLPRIDVPTLVVGGEVSHVDRRSQEWIAAQIPGATLTVFPREEGGAHFAFHESPRHFAAVLEAFVARSDDRVAVSG